MRQAAAPGQSLNPIPAGLLQIVKLRIVDAFGRSVTYGTGYQPLTVAVAAGLSAPTGLDGAFLPPRLAQPSVLRCQWLTPAGEAETTGAVAASPVLGWLAPGRANGGVFLYGADGTPLGDLLPTGEAATFLSAPGNGLAPGTGLATVMAAQPAIFQSFASALVAGTGSLTGLAAAIEEAQSTILPAAAPTLAPLAAIVGQPLALARASLSLSLLGPPAADQSWVALVASLSESSVTASPPSITLPNAGITQVNFPLSLGMPGALSDGLIGFWLIGAKGQPDFSTFYAPAGPATSGVEQPTATTLTVLPNGEPVEVLLLFDPRGEVAVASGVAPVQSLALPPDQYAAAIADLTISIPLGPVPTGLPLGAIALPLPPAAGGQWTFNSPAWQSPPTPGWVAITPVDATVAPPILPGTPQVLAEGWLTLTGVDADD